jgi:hypothetical protein
MSKRMVAESPEYQDIFTVTLAIPVLFWHRLSDWNDFFVNSNLIGMR